MFKAMRVECPRLPEAQKCQYWKTSYGTGEPKLCNTTSTNIIFLFASGTGELHSTSFLCDDHADIMTTDMERERVPVAYFYMNRGVKQSAYKE